MIDRLNIIVSRYNEIQEELLKPEVLADYSKMKTLSKEKSDLEEIVKKYDEYKETQKRIEDAKALINDPEMHDLAEMELDEATESLKTITHELEILLIPKDENDGKNIIMEIRGAAGGDEANIFAGDLFRMYSRYAEKQGWKIEVTNEVEGTAGGYSQIEFMITATVAVMPEAEEFDYELDMNEIRIDITRSSGCGGQGVNTTDSAVRLTHIPTGIIVYSQTERSQIRNKEKAIQIMKTRLYDLKLREKEEAEGQDRRNKIGTGDRSEKIRTYNYPQNRVTDHRIGFSVMNLDRVMDGDLDAIIDALITEDQRRKLENN